MAGITYFLIIAIENYSDSTGFPKVTYAKNDANDLIKSYLALGYSDSDIMHLQDSTATKSAIENNLELIVKKTLPQDRIIIYFAGHGLASADKNMLVPVDAISGFTEKTCVSINHLLGILKLANSKRNIIFLDCCHSGFEPGELDRIGVMEFDNDRLMMEYKDEEYCLGFASCQSHQISISDHHFKHGVWSHFLLEALKGNADKKIYEEGCLFSDALQEYLRDKTSEYVKLNTTPKRDQIPVQFGHLTKRFIIEDLSSIFAALEASKISKSLNVRPIYFSHQYSDLIKNHPDYIKGRHFVPNEYKGIHDSFIKKLSENIIEEDISAMSAKIKSAFGYKLREMKIEKSLGSASILTPDFDYEIEVTQSTQTPQEYIIARFAHNFENITVIESPEFNNVFYNTFSSLIFSFNKPIDIESVIDKIESKANSSLVSVEYNHNDLSQCVITIKGLKNSITVESDAIAIHPSYKSSPKELIDAFRDTNKFLNTKNIGILIK